MQFASNTVVAEVFLQPLIPVQINCISFFFVFVLLWESHEFPPAHRLLAHAGPGASMLLANAALMVCQ